MTPTLPVSEQFGPTLQGEGPHAGRKVQFLRLGACNLSCSWCDTPYTWDSARFNLRAELTPRTAEDIIGQLLPGVPLVVSGGEPLLHQANGAFTGVLRQARYDGIEIHVETNGTILPTEEVAALVDVFAVSPKMWHAGDHRGRDARLHPAWPGLAMAHRDTFLKVVVQSAEDVGWVAQYADEIRWPTDRVWVMPLGTHPADLMEIWPEIATEAARYRINATQRLHVLAWGDTKGT